GPCCHILVIAVHDALDTEFFFSSRGRHTRSKRDWSSDVCSSDLRPRYGRHELVGDITAMVRDAHTGASALSVPKLFKVTRTRRRSEERRVGKERRSRMGT